MTTIAATGDELFLDGGDFQFKLFRGVAGMRSLNCVSLLGHNSIQE
jgi:hypothetical protein